MILPLLLTAAALASQPIDPSPAAARAVIERYYAAIERGRYREAWRLWEREGAASGQTLAQFVRGFARTAHSRVSAGAPTDEEGAAGSMFVTVPVTVEARLTNGARQHFTGRYVLRRVNGVPGATREQLTWHIDSARLTPVR